MTYPDKIARLLVMNTALTIGTDPGPGFKQWRDFVANSPDFDVGALMKRAVAGITDEEVAAYSAPFPTAEYKAGVLRFPAIVPVNPDMDGAELAREAMVFWSQKWSGPTFMAIGMNDPVLGPPAMYKLKEILRGCPEPLQLENVGHFVQESGEAVARAALQAWK